MKRVIGYLEGVKEQLEDDWDRIAIVLGDEGVGKSTFILQCALCWQRVTDQDATIDDVIDTIAWNYDDFKRSLAHSDPYSMVSMHDMSRVLNRKRAMTEEAVEIENDLYDVRGQRLFVMMGYQEPSSIATILEERRAHNIFRIPTRGRVFGYNREQIDKYVDYEKWPSQPALTDSFGDLSRELPELWETFRARDLEEKQKRIEPDAGNIELKELANEIVNNGVENIISDDGRYSEYTPKIDNELIEIEYDLSARQARQVAKLIRRDEEVPTGPRTR